MRNVNQSLLKSAGLLLPILVTGCLSSGGSSSTPDAPGTPGDPGPGTPSATFYPLFDTGAGFAANAVPVPNNLYFAGTTDGTLNIPVDGVDEPALETMLELMNDLDGWSTVAPVRIPFNKAVDPASLQDSIRVYRTTLVSSGTADVLARAEQVYAEQGAAAAIAVVNEAVAAGAHQPLSGHQVPVAAFTCDDDVTDQFSISVSATDDKVVLLKPVKPLAAGDQLDCLAASGTFHAAVIEPSNLDFTAFSNGYLPLLLQGINSTDADAAGRSDGYEAVTADPAQLGGQYQAINQTIDAKGVDPDRVVLGFTFSTQSISHALDYLATNSSGSPAASQWLPPLVPRCRGYPFTRGCCWMRLIT